MDEYTLQNTNDSLPVGDGDNVIAVDGSMLLVSIIIVIVMHTVMDQHT